jgi:hypothetical protein
MTLDNPKLDSQASLNQGESTYVFLDSEAKQITKEVKAKVLDEGFVTKKEYKKLLKSLSQYAAGNKDTYHLQLI